jgi:hypothetical protein
MPETNQSKVINAPVAEVWKKFADFHDMSWAPNVISSVDKVGDVDGASVGAKRILNNAFHETLVEIDDAGHSLRYSIDDGPSPVSRDEVSNYFGSVRLSPANDGKGTLVEWTSNWDSDKDDAVAFCHGIYVALLDELANSYA